LIEDRVAKASDYGKRAVSISELEMIIADVWDAQFGPLSKKELKQRQPVFNSLAERIIIR
jgi:hypothetical protein